jgi:hypothetical protein
MPRAYGSWADAHPLFIATKDRREQKGAGYVGYNEQFKVANDPLNVAAGTTASQPPILNSSGRPYIVGYLDPDKPIQRLVQLYDITAQGVGFVILNPGQLIPHVLREDSASNYHLCTGLEIDPALSINPDQVVQLDGHDHHNHWFKLTTNGPTFDVLVNKNHVM